VSERGLANGLMFGGAYLGQAIGGSGVLFLAPLVGFRNTYFFVAGFILLVTLFVVLPMREPKSEPLGPSAESPLLAAFRRIVLFVTESVRSFFSSRGAFVGVLFALLPAGAYALGLALQSNLAVELGLSDPQVAGLNLWSSIASALGCVVGGWLSDRFGRRKMITLFIVGSAIPTAILAMQMKQAGWVLPLAPDMLNRPVPPLWLVQQFWLMTIAYSVFQGLMYGTRTAMFMDVTNPKVAATQFTAYMAMLNFVISYTARWQGVALAKWGYPVTLGLDAAAGLVCLLALPFMAPRRAGASSPAPGAAVEPATG
jgi:PAT family beta-lactamase induction signal transducer AmpG